MSLLLGRLRKNKWQLKRLLRFETHFLSWVCAYAWEGWGGREMLLKLPWWFNFINPPPLPPSPIPHPLPSASLTLISSLEQKKQIFLRGIPSVAGAAAGFTNWSESTVWVNVFPTGDPCSDMQIYADLLSTEVTQNNVHFWNFVKFHRLEIIRMEMRARTITFSGGSRLFRAVDEHRRLECVKCQIPFFCTLNSSQVGSCLA